MRVDPCQALKLPYDNPYDLFSIQKSLMLLFRHHLALPAKEY